MKPREKKKLKKEKKKEIKEKCGFCYVLLCTYDVGSYIRSVSSYMIF